MTSGIYTHAAAIEYSRVDNITFQVTLKAYMTASNIPNLIQPAPKKIENIRNNKSQNNVDKIADEKIHEIDTNTSEITLSKSLCHSRQLIDKHHHLHL